MDWNRCYLLRVHINSRYGTYLCYWYREQNYCMLQQALRNATEIPCEHLAKASLLHDTFTWNSERPERSRSSAPLVCHRCHRCACRWQTHWAPCAALLKQEALLGYPLPRSFSVILREGVSAATSVSKWKGLWEGILRQARRLDVLCSGPTEYS